MITMFIVDDDRIRRQGFRSFLEGKDGIEILGACSREDIPARVAALRPDVVLLDVSTDGSPTVIQTIHASWPPAKVVTVGVDDDELSVLLWLERGASHYVPKGAEESELFATVLEVMADDFRWPGCIGHALLERVQELAAAERVHEREARLTRREREIARFLARGLSTGEIARELVISPATVKNHIHHILQKAHTHRRSVALARLESDLQNQDNRAKK